MSNINMASLLKNFVGSIVNIASANINPHKVQMVSISSYDGTANVCKEGHILLYKLPGCYDALLVNSALPVGNKAIRLFRLTGEADAYALFTLYTTKLEPLSCSSRILYQEETVQKACDVIREHPTWTPAHVAASTGLHECFNVPVIAKDINMRCAITKMTPVMSAIMAGQGQTVTELVLCGALLNACDMYGASVFHYAVKSDPAIITILAEFMDTLEIINWLNGGGESALHIACRCSNEEATIKLLEAGADPTLTGCEILPIHMAVNMSNVKSVQVICNMHPKQALAVESRHGGTPLHWAKTKEIVDVLVGLGADYDSVSRTGDSVLHVMMKHQRLDCVMAVLCHGADVNISGKNGNRALHLAVQALDDKPFRTYGKMDNLDLIKSLLVFDAKVNLRNDHNQTARHLVSVSKSKNKLKQGWARHIIPRNFLLRDLILYMLHMSGAERCKTDVKGCLTGCLTEGTYCGNPDAAMTAQLQRENNAFNDGMFADGLSSWGSTTGNLDRTLNGPRKSSDKVPVPFVDPRYLVTCWRSITYKEILPGVPGAACTFAYSGLFSQVYWSKFSEVLCLDGGGIRGLVLIQLLLCIENTLGRPLVDCFDWIAGTSTGGLLALGLAHGKSLRYCLGMYIRLKDEVFQGRRPYSSTLFENLLKKEFGVNTKMTAISNPKVLVTTVLSDRYPADLHFFRNYIPPVVKAPEVKSPVVKTPESVVALFKQLSSEKKGPQLVIPPLPEEQPIWEAARCSGAAPTYFRAYGPYLDGGLMANNPTLDVLTEIHKYNSGLRMTGLGDSVRPLGCVLSLGTGRIPVIPVETVDVFLPEGVMDAVKCVKGISALKRILVDQATVSEGRPVERARAMCSMMNIPYFRFSPHLSEDIPLDCTDTKMLLRMMWETRCYMVANSKMIDRLVERLK